MNRTLRIACVLATALGALWLATVAMGIVVFILLGPKTPNAHSSRGMHMKITPKSAPAGTTFKAKATGFTPGEYTGIWEYWSGGHSTELNGGFVNSRGAITVYPDTAAGISSGRRKLCVQGLKSKRIACARFVVKANGGGTGPGYAPPVTGPGYVPPTSG